MNLYHVSEEESIIVFEPRPVQKNSYGLSGNVVWAIDRAHVVNYLLPRECPRVCYFAGENTSGKDVQKFFPRQNNIRIVAVESVWLERILNAKLFLYEFPAESFRLADKTAGYYV